MFYTPYFRYPRHHRDLWAKILCLIFLTIVSVSPNLYAQKNNPSTSPSTALRTEFRASSGQRLKFERLSTAQGLSQDVVYCIFQDKKGFMWFGTGAGLNRYDGYHFTIYTHDPENSHSLGGNKVRAIYEDRSGTLWIGTEDGGLNRFDRNREQFVRYQHDPNNPHSVSSNKVVSMYEDRSGTLWVGTLDGGLNRFDPRSSRGESGQFFHYQHDPDNPQSLSSNEVFAVHEGRSGALWIGAYGGGLHKLDPDTQQFSRYQHDPDDPQSLSDNRIVSIYAEQSEVFWIGTEGGGLNKFDPNTGKFVRYQTDPTEPSRGVSHNGIFPLHKDRSGVFWIGTLGGGLNRFDPETEKFTRYQTDPNYPYSLSNNIVLSMYEDPSGVLWIGTAGGINTLSPETKQFLHYQNDPHDSSSLSVNTVTSVFEDRSGTFWVGTGGGGLNRFSRNTKNVTHYRHNPNDPLSLSHDVVLSIYEDRLGVLWIGTEDGLNKVVPSNDEGGDVKKFAFLHYRHDPDNPQSLSSNKVRAIYEDRAGIFWLATDGGLNRFDRNTERFFRYRHDPDNPQSLSSNAVRAIYEDRTGIIWVGTIGGGVNRFDRKTTHFIRYRHDPGIPGTLSHDVVGPIYEDQSGTLWIGTFGGGLNKLVPSTSSGGEGVERAHATFIHYSRKDGLPSDVIYGITEDRQGNLWLSTNNGLSRFTPQTAALRNYDTHDGLPGNRFMPFASFKSKRGEMFFGNVNGVIAFYPQHVKENSHVPPIVMTDFQLFNNAVEVGRNSPLQKSITETEVIELSYNDYVFSFQFAALDYFAPEKNQYAYLLEGFDRDWVYSGARRFVTYTHIPAGTYTFRVKGSNNDGVWNEESRSIKIIVVPPWWGTWWAYILYVLLAIGSVWGFVQWRVRTTEIQKRELEIQVNARTRDLAEKTGDLARSNQELEIAKNQADVANQAKSTFLANMSHELRTPLNSILGFTQLMARNQRIPVGEQENLTIIRRSGEHLLTLINQVLDLSKIEAGRITLNAKNFDLYRVLDEMQDMFHLRAQEKQLQLLFTRTADLPRYVRTDEARLRQVLMNLLDNAIKFTEEGSITLQIADAENPKTQNSKLKFTMSDTGPGITPDELESVFEAFSQTKTGREAQAGTGLGLAISRKFAQLMGGDLSVKSEVGRGTTFMCHIVVTKVDAVDIESVQSSRRVIALEPGQSRYRILIVDDEWTNRQLLLKLLEPLDFDLRDAENGQKTIEIWEEWQPHLIWLDMRMPVMDGYEAAREIRSKIKNQQSKIQTAIIALTASSFEEERAVVLSVGCDDFLRKPFLDDEVFDLMTKHLGVRYVYEEQRKAEGVISGGVEGRQKAERKEVLTPESLAVLPADLLVKLEQDTIQGNKDQVLKHIEIIRSSNAVLADALTQLVNDFEYTKILAYIREAGGQHESFSTGQSES
ncbi:MAG: response regulator [bacterium]|nr:response regulator [bacterium]